MGQLDLTIVEARNLPAHRYYIKAAMMMDGWRDIKVKTKRSSKSGTPYWNQRFIVPVRNAITCLLSLELYVDPKWGFDRRVDAILIPLNTLFWNTPLDMWWDLASSQIHLILTALDFGVNYMPYPNYPPPVPYPTYAYSTPPNPQLATGPQVIYVNETQNQQRRGRDTGDMLMAGGLGLVSGLLLGEII